MPNTLMPCGLDDPRIRYEPDVDEDDVDPRTGAEKRMQWICEYWGDALVNDTSDSWAEVRDYLLGAAMTLIHTTGRISDAEMVSELHNFALENQIDCIRRGK